MYRPNIGRLLYIHVRVCSHICIYAAMHVYTQTHVHIYIYIDMRADVFVYAHMFSV